MMVSLYHSGNSLEYAKPFAVFTTTPLQQSKAEQFALNLSKISNVDIRLAAGYEENFSWVIMTIRGYQTAWRN